MGEAREQNEPVSSSSKREQKMLRAESWMVEWFLNWYQWWIVHTTINVNNNYQVRVSIYWLYLWVLTAMLRSISFTTTTNWIDRLSGLYSSEKRRRFSSFVLIRFSKLLQGPRGGMVSCSCDHHIHATRTYISDTSTGRLYTKWSEPQVERTAVVGRSQHRTMRMADMIARKHERKTLRTETIPVNNTSTQWWLLRQIIPSSIYLYTHHTPVRWSISGSIGKYRTECFSSDGIKKITTPVLFLKAGDGG